jgi:hypothetical protein
MMMVRWVGVTEVVLYCTVHCRVSAGLHHIRAPLVDLEVRGVPALQYFGNVIWTDDVFEKLNAGM